MFENMMPAHAVALAIGATVGERAQKMDGVCASVRFGDAVIAPGEIR